MKKYDKIIGIKAYTTNKNQQASGKGL